MGLDLGYIYGQTPLDEDEREGLLVPFITTRGELDEFEQQNIEQAVQWSLGRSVRAETLFSEKFVKQLHKRMYGDVWQWAGVFRKSNKNIGVDKWQIPTVLHSLLEDTKFCMASNTYEPDELIIRLKHRLVSIHCFPNGNGRHSRLMADIAITKIYKLPVYTWGAKNAPSNEIGLVKQGNQRAAYLRAIKGADAGDMQPLISFARS